MSDEAILWRIILLKRRNSANDTRKELNITSDGTNGTFLLPLNTLVAEWEPTTSSRRRQLCMLRMEQQICRRFRINISKRDHFQQFGKRIYYVYGCVKRFRNVSGHI
jgi:glucose dehydrogenase